MSTILSDAGLQFADASVQPSAARPQLQSLGVTKASNALTIASQQFSLTFKTSLTSGAVQTITGSPAALVIPSGASLGSISATPSSIIVAALNNAGTIEYAVQNLAGGSDMSETGVINTVAISSGATANNVWYSNTARTGVPYTIITRIDSTQAIAGTWATDPTLIQGAGGQALSVMGGLGYGQTWQNVTGSRTSGTTYYNTTAKPIDVVVSLTQFTGVAAQATLSVNGVVVATARSDGGATAYAGNSMSVTVPPRASYILSSILNALLSWSELR